MLRGAAVLALPALAACATFPSPGELAAYENPADRIGSVATICGYMDGTANITQRPSGARGGLGRGYSVKSGDHRQEILDRVRAGQRRFCLEGTVFRTGCGTETCMERGFDHGIEVRRLRQPRGATG